jgi:hypothetical protein
VSYVACSKYFILVAAAIVATAAIGTAVGSVSTGSSAQVEPSGPVLFSDYFNSSSDPNWTFFNRSGHIDGGRLWIDGGYTSDAVGRDGWALTHIGDKTWKDYAVDVAYDNGNIGGSPDHHMAMIYFRVASAGGHADVEGGRRTMYRLDVWDPGDAYEGGSCSGIYAPSPAGWVQLIEYSNSGALTWLGEACFSNTVHGTNFVRVVVKGNTIETLINGKTIMTVNDPTPIQYGGVGVGQIWETNGWFDNVTVRGSGTRTTSD